MRKAITKAVAVILHQTCGAKNNRAFMVVARFGSSFLSSSIALRCHSQLVLATDMRLAKMPANCMNCEKVESDESLVSGHQADKGHCKFNDQ